jgi:hypothetical protein
LSPALTIRARRTTDRNLLSAIENPDNEKEKREKMRKKKEIKKKRNKEKKIYVYEKKKI